MLLAALQLLSENLAAWCSLITKKQIDFIVQVLLKVCINELLLLLLLL